MSFAKNYDTIVIWCEVAVCGLSRREDMKRLCRCDTVSFCGMIQERKRMMDYRRASKKLSYYLRHCEEPRYISLDGGWADIDVIIRALKEKLPWMNREILGEIVEQDEKGRYSISPDGLKIRANQGHSIEGVVIKMKQVDSPPEYLYHGTAQRFLDSILKDGLRSMSRNYVHISTDYATALKVGSRHGKPVVLQFGAADFVRDGYKLYISDNGVWQAEFVPPEYLSVLYDDPETYNGTN